MAELIKAPWSDWETVRMIGRGSFGTVYEIQRKLVDEDTESAALKVITIPQNQSDVDELYSEGYDDESITATFNSHLKSIVAEYSLMRKMDGSANIVNCKDIRYIQHDDGIGWDIFIRMELLTPLMKALPADTAEQTIIKIGKDICNALVLCKKHEIIHRDIKPQNIFVSPNGDYKLGDFGIAKTVEKTMGGTKIGTYKYMAPEVYNNQPYGSAADIYSLGLVLYWLLNERRMPFMPLPPAKLMAGMDEDARQRRLSGEKLPAPAHGSDELKQIVLKACAFDPKDRYQSAAAMLEDLNSLGSGAAPVVIAPVTEDPIEADEKTTGPAFTGKKNPPAEENLTEGTVGPVFTPKKETPKAEKASTEGTFGPKDSASKTKRKILWLIPVIAGILIILLLHSCWKPTVLDIPTDTTDSPETSLPQETIYSVPCQSLTLADDTDIVLREAGETRWLGVQVQPENTTDFPTYASNDESVVIVSDQGELTAVGEGVAVITVICSSQKLQCTVTCDFALATTEPVAEEPKQEDKQSEKDNNSSGSKPTETKPTETKPAAVLTSISIASLPNKLTYYSTDVIDTTGLVLKLIYSDGTTKQVTSGFDTMAGFSFTDSGQHTVTVYYEGKSTTYSVNVIQDYITGVSIDEKPNQTVFLRGDTFSSEGLELLATWSSGKANTIFTGGFSVSVPNLDMHTAGTYTATVTLDNEYTKSKVSTTYEVQVTDHVSLYMHGGTSKSVTRDYYSYDVVASDGTPYYYVELPKVDIYTLVNCDATISWRVSSGQSAFITSNSSKYYLAIYGSHDTAWTKAIAYVTMYGYTYEKEFTAVLNIMNRP